MTRGLDRSNPFEISVRTTWEAYPGAALSFFFFGGIEEVCLIIPFGKEFKRVHQTSISPSITITSCGVRIGFSRVRHPFQE